MTTSLLTFVCGCGPRFRMAAWDGETCADCGRRMRLTLGRPLPMTFAAILVHFDQPTPQTPCLLSQLCLMRRRLSDIHFNDSGLIHSESISCINIQHKSLAMILHKGAHVAYRLHAHVIFVSLGRDAARLCIPSAWRRGFPPLLVKSTPVNTRQPRPEKGADSPAPRLPDQYSGQKLP